MIGNLILALGIACLSASAIHTDNFNHVNDIDNFIETESTSYVTGLPCTFYAQIQDNFLYIANNNDSSVRCYDIYNNGSTSIYYTDGVLNTIVGFQSIYSDVGDSSYLNYFTQKINNKFYIRLVVPYNALYKDITDIECGFSVNNSTTELNGAYNIYYQDEGGLNVKILSSSFMKDFNGVKKENWFLLSDIIGYTTSYTADYYNSDINSLRFYNYLIEFDNFQNLSAVFFCRFLGNLQEGYTNGFQDGYSTGFREGESKGYLNGYVEGLSVGSGGNTAVKNLFGVIADTPIRFLKDMFNFELFGMNVAVVILSCLTAIVMFTLIKKIWK